MRPWLDLAREVEWLTVNTYRQESPSWKLRDGTYRTAADLLYSLLGSISRPFSSTFFSKSNVDRTDAAASVRVEWAICSPGQILPEKKKGWRILDKWSATYGLLVSCSPPTESKCNIHGISNWTVEFSILQEPLGFKFVRFRIVPFVVQHCPKEQSLKKEESSKMTS